MAWQNVGIPPDIYNRAMILKSRFEKIAGKSLSFAKMVDFLIDFYLEMTGETLESEKSKEINDSSGVEDDGQGDTKTILGLQSELPTQ